MKKQVLNKIRYRGSIGVAVIELTTEEIYWAQELVKEGKVVRYTNWNKFTGYWYNDKS